MKTAEEWAKRVQNSKEPWAKLVAGIQLDAMREGMKRAAVIAEIPANANPISEYGKGTLNGHYWAKQSILSAAEQLSEKDL